MNYLVENPKTDDSDVKMNLANRLFFRLYQCVNMMHKTGSRVFEDEGLTTQQLAVMGILSQEKRRGGMSVGALAHHLMVSRQNLSGLISRMERAGHVAIIPSGQDRRSRLVSMTESGRHAWQVLAQPKVRAYHDEVLANFSVNDITHTLHYLLKMLENMQQLDAEQNSADDDAEARPLE